MSKKQWIKLGIQYVMFTAGLAIMAFACYMMIIANLGVAPWEVLNIGLYQTLGLTIGTWAQLVGIFIIIISYLIARIRPGIGTILNMLFFGWFIVLFIWLDLVPTFEGFVQNFLLFLVSLVLISIGIGMYLSSRLGAGPRDTFMIAIHERKGWSIQIVRSIIEIVALTLGWLLGGPVHIGTILVALLTGPMIQHTIPFFVNIMKKLEKIGGEENVPLEGSFKH